MCIDCATQRWLTISNGFVQWAITECRDLSSPVNNPRLKNMYFSFRNKGGVSTSFCKSAITFIDNPCLVLILYHVNESTTPKLKHGNRKNNNREHKRTYPSVISVLKSEIVHEPPNKLYKMLVIKE